MNGFRELLRAREVVLLDGATGTELQRRGVELPLPLWTADAAVHHADLLQRIHLDYLEAGADIVTANTFRTNGYSLAQAGRRDEARDLTLRTVEIARQAVSTHGAGWVAGCMAPLEDCYEPQRVPSNDILLREHAMHAKNLSDAGVDVILVETMNTSREAHAAAETALATGLPVLVSLVPDPRGDGDPMSGEDLEVAWAHLRGLPIAALLVNCAPAGVLSAALHRMRWNDEDRPIGAFANAGALDAYGGWSGETCIEPEAYAREAQSWRNLGARIVGGCCYTTPAHIRALSRVIGVQ